MNKFMKACLLVSLLLLMLHGGVASPKKVDTITINKSISPKTVLGLKCLKFFSKYNRLKQHKAFAYAREADTNKEECAYAFGYKNTQGAEDEAIKLCRQFILNSECKLIDLDGKFLVKDNDFSLLTPLNKTKMTKDDEKKLLDKASTLINGSCLKFFQKYLKEPGHKIFLYGVKNNKFVCAKSSGENTLKEAKVDALKYCKKSKCKIFALNTDIIAKATDFNKTIIPIVKIKLTDTIYKEYLAKAKSIIKEKSCLLQFKYYLESSQHKAYFITNSQNNTQACGRSEEKDNPEAAKREALKNCNKMTINKNINSKCKLYNLDFKFFN